MIAHKGKTRFV